jgi:DNA invertase Pin-like site-specific DNA recombinase
MRAVGYVRVSTQGQADDGVSLEAQRAKLAAYCQLNDGELLEVFADEGVSGTDRSRAGLAAAMALAKKHRAALVVYSLSRLTRSTRHALELADELERAGCDLVSLSEKIDTTTPAGRMVFRLLAALAEFERDQTAARTSDALQHLKRQGRRYGTVPHGMRAVEGGRLEQDQAEQEILRIVRELRADGMSLREISAELASRGAFNRQGRPFNPKSLRSILLQAA